VGVNVTKISKSVHTTTKSEASMHS